MANNTNNNDDAADRARRELDRIDEEEGELTNSDWSNSANEEDDLSTASSVQSDDDDSDDDNQDSTVGMWPMSADTMDTLKQLAIDMHERVSSRGRYGNDDHSLRVLGVSCYDHTIVLQHTKSHFSYSLMKTKI